MTAWAEDAASRVSRGWGSRARAALVLDPGLQTGERVCVALTPAMTAVGSAAASLFHSSSLVFVCPQVSKRVHRRPLSELCDGQLLQYVPVFFFFF